MCSTKMALCGPSNSAAVHTHHSKQVFNKLNIWLQKNCVLAVICLNPRCVLVGEGRGRAMFLCIFVNEKQPSKRRRWQ